MNGFNILKKRSYINYITIRILYIRILTYLHTN